MFLAPETVDGLGILNYVHPKVSKPTQDACNLRIFSHVAPDFWGGVEEKTSDLETFLVGKVYHLAAYATALTHSPQPICWDASCSGLVATAAWLTKGLQVHLASYHPGMALSRRANCTIDAEAPKFTWKQHAHVKMQGEGPVSCQGKMDHKKPFGKAYIEPPPPPLFL